MNDLENEPLVYGVDAAARTANIGRTKLYEEINAGRLKARKFGRRTLITADALKKWLNSLPQMNGEV